MRFCQRDFPIDSSHQKCSVRKGFLRNFAKFIGEGLCQSLCFLTKLQALDLNKKEALAQVFSCEFCKMSKNTFFAEHLWATASEFMDFFYVKIFTVSDPIEKQ